MDDSKWSRFEERALQYWLEGQDQNLTAVLRKFIINTLQLHTIPLSGSEREGGTE